MKVSLNAKQINALRNIGWEPNKPTPRLSNTLRAEALANKQEGQTIRDYVSKRAVQIMGVDTKQRKPSIKTAQNIVQTQMQAQTQKPKLTQVKL